MKIFNKLLLLVQNGYLDQKSMKAQENEIYFINIENEIAGFFALLRTVLDYCCYADENGFVPFIKYSRRTPYGENAFFLGTNNPFEYYFKQPMAAQLFLTLKGVNIIKNRKKHYNEVEYKYNSGGFSYFVDESYIEHMSEIYNKYIQLNDKTDSMIRKSVKNILKKKRTLGVHIRGTDFRKEFNNHPLPVTIDECIDAISEAIHKQHYDQVFIATDDEGYLEILRERILIPLVFYKSTMRASGNKSVIFERTERRHNNYLLGLEVLRDVYTLVECEGFIGCLSQIDIFVQIIKRSRSQKFDLLNIIDKGVSCNNKVCWEPIK